MAIGHERTPAGDALGYSERARAERLTGGGTSGNERLTTVSGPR
ncbi:MAG TPA: hypothetical protein VIJ39_15705 [Solirubrobacteraceae bacterium]